MKMFDALCKSDKKLDEDSAKFNRWLNDWNGANNIQPSRYNALVHLLMEGVKPINAIAIVANASADGRLIE